VSLISLIAPRTARRSHPAAPLSCLAALLPAVLLLAAPLVLAPCAHAQSPSSSSSSSSSTPPPKTKSIQSPDNGSALSPLASRKADPNGSAISLETSEPLFDLAVALNACGYNDDLDHSVPIRATIRAEVESTIAASPDAQAARTPLCAYIRKHQLTDPGLNLAQYISLALYLNPPPELTITVDEPDLPPDSTQIVNILPLLRTFATAIQLHPLWIKYRPEYEELLARVHDPLTNLIYQTNIYLKLSVSSYEGRRFLVLLEPMLAPSNTNARIYVSDFIVVTSPALQPPPNRGITVPIDLIRHTFLHYELEPLIYSRTTAMERLQPLLRTVQDAPIEFTYKSDIIALITECMIKAVEAHTMNVDLPVPDRPNAAHADRIDQERYTSELLIYDRESEAIRRRTVTLDMRQGWVLTEYFYDRLAQMQRDGTSLKDDMGEIVYGMDVERERHHDEQITFLPEASRDILRRAPRALTGLDLAESKLVTGDRPAALAIANQILADPNPALTEEHARAHYLIARLDLLNQDPEKAVTDFQAALAISKDPRTLAWCHIYLGRLFDMQQEPDRKAAVSEYRLALNLRDDQPDTRAAAESGLKAPFAPPQPAPQQDDNAPLDPTGKAEKQSYQPSPRP
jgi:hypothetical protein